jgi:signal transduction histidine kinase
VSGWLLQNLYERSLALTQAESSGDVLQPLLQTESWKDLPEGGRTSAAPFQLLRTKGLPAPLPVHSVPLILVIEGKHTRAAVSFASPPKLLGALGTGGVTLSTNERLAELSRGIARQDQSAQLHVFFPDDVVLTISAPDMWHARKSQTWVVIIGILAAAASLSLLLPPAINLSAPFARLARKGPIKGVPDPLASSEAYLIEDKINRLAERFQVEQERKERNLAAISHDLNTPVTRLRLRTELLKEDAVRERFEADLDELSNMIDGALDLLSLRSRTEESFQFSLASLVESLCNDYSDIGKKVEFTPPEQVEMQSAASIFTAPGDVTVRTDNTCMMFGQPDKLRRAFSNLIDNALKYGGRAVVEVKPFSNEMISVGIRDFGPGIEPDQIARVQQPFVRGHNTQSQRGVGLGLSIAAELIELHGGKLEFVNMDPGLLVTAIVLRGAQTD